MRHFVSTIVLTFLLTITVYAKADMTYIPPAPPVQVIEIPSYITPDEVLNYLLVADNFPASFLPIIECESGYRQFAKPGVPLVSPTKDYGLMQLSYKHIPEATAMGLDIVNSTKDNVAFAKTLYDERGEKPWTCSKLV